MKGFSILRDVAAVAVVANCFGGGARAADPEFTNSLGMGFVEVAGTPSLMAQWEVRVKDFRAFVEASGFEWDGGVYFEQSADHPVVGISRSDAVVFCEWLTQKEKSEGKLTEGQRYRLPTSYEWSRASGLVNVDPNSPALEKELEAESHFVWGRSWPPPEGAGNFSDLDLAGYEDGHQFTSPVGSYQPSADGVYDLAGNAWEWVYDPGGRNDDVGVLRGGSFVYFRKRNLLASYEYRVDAGTREGTFGFRVVLEDKARNEAFLKAQSENRASASATVQKSLLPPEMANQTETPGADGPDLSGVQPKPGEAHRNTLQMSFVPVADLAGLLVGAHEVRLKDFDSFIDGTKREWSTRPTYSQTGDHAVAGVSWEAASAFCRWLTELEQASGALAKNQYYRLPTDAEWSVLAGLGVEGGSSPAARDSSTDTRFPWGDEWPPPPDTGNFEAATISGYSENIPYTAPVGTFEKAENGLYDLAGNVAEWVEDLWQPGSKDHVARGGSWIDYERVSLLAAKRVRVAGGSARGNIGFRCVVVTGN